MVAQAVPASRPARSPGRLRRQPAGAPAHPVAGVDRAGSPVDDESWPREVLDLFAGFRRAAVAQLIDRLDRLCDERPVERLSVSGGVAANRLLRREAVAWGERRGAEILLVPLRYCGDNAAMIAHAGLLRLRRGDVDDPRSADAESRIPFAPVT